MLRAAKEFDPELPVIVMTAYGSIEDAVAAMKEGALDFLAKPVDPDHLLLLVARALEQRRMVTENLLLKEELAERRGAPQLVGEDPRCGRCSRSLQRARRPTRPCCSKGRAAPARSCSRALHALSPRADAPFVAINCAAIPETLLETELFGHEKGAFTGAVARKPGKFEMAHRGTLFLDEIGDLPLALQAKILRALEEKRFERVGGTRSCRSTCGVVAATNRELRAPVAAAVPRGSVLPAVGVPDHGSAAARAARRHPAPGAPLRRSLLPRHEEEAADAVAGGARAARAPIAGPGNVRELQNCIERAVILPTATRSSRVT